MADKKGGGNSHLPPQKVQEEYESLILIASWPVALIGALVFVDPYLFKILQKPFAEDLLIPLGAGVATMYFLGGRQWPWASGQSAGEFVRNYLAGGLVAYAVADKELHNF